MVPEHGTACQLHQSHPSPPPAPAHFLVSMGTSLLLPHALNVNSIIESYHKDKEEEKKNGELRDQNIRKVVFTITLVVAVAISLSFRYGH